MEALSKNEINSQNTALSCRETTLEMECFSSYYPSSVPSSTQRLGTGEVTQQLREYRALAKDSSSVSHTHMPPASGDSDASDLHKHSHTEKTYI